MKVLGVIAAMAIGLVVRGMVLQALWGWFVASKFGIATLGLADAIGLALLVSLLTYQYDARTPDEAKPYPLTEALVAGLAMSGLAYLLGAIVNGLA